MSKLSFLRGLVTAVQSHSTYSGRPAPRPYAVGPLVVAPGYSCGRYYWPALYALAGVGLVVCFRPRVRFGYSVRVFANSTKAVDYITSV